MAATIINLQKQFPEATQIGGGTFGVVIRLNGSDCPHEKANCMETCNRWALKLSRKRSTDHLVAKEMINTLRVFAALSPDKYTGAPRGILQGMVIDTMDQMVLLSPCGFCTLLYAIKDPALRAALTLQKSRVLYDVIHGVAFLHDTVKMAHRDLKPANIILFKDKDGELHARVGDLGSAELHYNGSNMKTRGFCPTTDAYRSPEAFMAGEEISRPPKAQTKDDVWALGCIAFEMVMGVLLVHTEPTCNHDILTKCVHLVGSKSIQNRKECNVSPDLGSELSRLKAMPENGTLGNEVNRMKLKHNCHRSHPDVVLLAVQPFDERPATAPHLLKAMKELSQRDMKRRCNYEEDEEPECVDLCGEDTSDGC